MGIDLGPDLGVYLDVDSEADFGADRGVYLDGDLEADLDDELGPDLEADSGVDLWSPSLGSLEHIKALQGTWSSPASAFPGWGVGKELLLLGAQEWAAGSGGV